MGVTGELDLGGKATTLSGVGQSYIGNTATFLNWTPSSSTSTHNHQYTLYEAGSGKKLAEQKAEVGKGGDVRFTFQALELKKEYNLKITITKGAIAVEPEEQPKPAPSPSYTLESYTVTETRTSGENAPDYTKPILQISRYCLY